MSISLYNSCIEELEIPPNKSRKIKVISGYLSSLKNFILILKNPRESTQEILDKLASVMKLKKEDKWANAVKAVIYGFTSGGYTLDGIDFTIYSQILPSAGFGITTAIKVAVAIAIKELFKLNCNDNVLLQVLERANKLFLQTTNHVADNYTALFSKKDNLLITDHFKSSWDYAGFDFPDKKILAGLFGTRIQFLSLSMRFCSVICAKKKRMFLAAGSILLTSPT